MTVVGSAVAVSHQLSPYIIGGTLAVLVVFRQVRPWWAPATLLGPAAIWALLHWSDIAGFLSFGDLGKADNFRPPETTATPGLHRLPIVTATVLALVAGALLVGLIALGVLLRHRRELRMWAIAMCPAVGLAVVAVNPYGNEGIFRATLFALPWLAILAAQAFAGAGRWTRAALPATTVALAVTFCVAAFGLDATNVLRSADREALRIFLNTEADPGQMNYMLILGPGDLPSSPPTQALTHAAIEWSDFRAEQGVAPVGTPAATEMRRATAGLRKYAAEHAANGGSLYAVWSPVSSYYGWEYGIHTPAQFAALRDAFLASPDWRPVFRSGGTVLFRYVAGTS